MTEDNISQLGDYGVHSVNNNTRMGLVISLCSNSDHLISLIPLKLPPILAFTQLWHCSQPPEATELITFCFRFVAAILKIL